MQDDSYTFYMFQNKNFFLKNYKSYVIVLHHPALANIIQYL